MSATLPSCSVIPGWSVCGSSAPTTPTETNDTGITGGSGHYGANNPPDFIPTSGEVATAINLDDSPPRVWFWTPESGWI